MKTNRTAPLSAILVLTLFCASGCHHIPSTAIENNLDKEEQAEGNIPESTQTVQYYIHTIKWPGENLGWISLWYTGSPNNWQQIVKANPSLTPEKIRIGDSIRIPEDLLIKREPMPKDFRGSATQLKPLTPQPLSPSPSLFPPSGEIELFGPIE